jgi:ubiquinone biosynthesis protein COQ4
MATKAFDTITPPARPTVAAVPFDPTRKPGRDWKGAWAALRELLANGNDTVQVFRIMRALNADTGRRNYLKLLTSVEGGRIAYERVELSERFSDRAWLDALPEGTVGAAYRAFLDRTGFSAKGLAEVALTDFKAGDAPVREAPHPYAWFGRRERDIHDIWHTLTGYTAEEHLGEACLVAFSYAQTGGLGWAAIALGAAVKSIRQTGGYAVVAAIREGYRHGKAAKWLSGEDYEALLAEPLDAARRRLNIAEPVLYKRAQAMLKARGLSAI